jgi:hypothetical protein
MTVADGADARDAVSPNVRAARPAGWSATTQAAQLPATALAFLLARPKW